MFADDLLLYIRSQKEILYLGIFLDIRLTWAKHINEVARRATLAVNIMKAMSKITWELVSNPCY